jgi:tRNA-dihydrouridine synthase A
MIPYLEQIAARGGRLHHATRHMIGLYHGQPRAKFWRQRLTTHITQTNLLQDYIDLVEQMDD